jgi:hypothetical protein
MKSKLTSIRGFVGSVAVGVLALSLVGSARAQGGAPPGAGPPGILNPKKADDARQMEQGQLRSAEMTAAVESENQKHIQAAIVNLKENFARIQILRNDIARNLVAHKPLDYSLISEQVGEINKRANDLNVYMLARSAENSEESNPPGLRNDEIIGALVKLCKLIDSFTENPALKHAATVDVNDIAKAKAEKAEADKELLAIIKLSDSIKKKSDKLKAPQ